MSSGISRLGLCAKDVVPQVDGDAKLNEIVSKVVPHVMRLHILEPGEFEIWPVTGFVVECEMKSIVDE